MSERTLIPLSEWADSMGMSVSGARYHCQMGNIPGAEKRGSKWMVPYNAHWPGDAFPVLVGDLSVIGKYQSRFEPISRDLLLNQSRYASSVCKVGTAYKDADVDFNTELCLDWLDRNLISDMVDLPYKTDLSAFLTTGVFKESPIDCADVILDDSVFDHMRVFWSERLKQGTVVAHSYCSGDKISDELQKLASCYPCVGTMDEDGSWYWPGNATLVTLTGPVTFLSWLLTEKLDEDSPIGDFARDVLADEFFPRCFDYASLYRHMLDMQACVDAFETLKLAYSEYSCSLVSCGKAMDDSILDAVERIVDRMWYDMSYPYERKSYCCVTYGSDGDKMRCFSSIVPVSEHAYDLGSALDFQS